MITQSLAQLTEVVGGRLIGTDVEIERVNTDSRRLQPGDLFVALVGERFDGHDFVASAAEAGASAVLVSRELDSSLPQILVEDTLMALGQLGAWLRREVNPYSVALTGSVGKTSVKEMAAAIFAQAGETLATRGNLNNTIGVPLTLLELEPQHRFGVFELGANHAGEIRYTSSLVRPDVALINNIQPAHLEGFGGMDGVYRAKSEIFEYLAADGKAVVNLDDDRADDLLALLEDRDVIRFSSETVADVWAEQVEPGNFGHYRFNLHRGEHCVPVQLPVAGRHQVNNALAAASLASAAELSLELIAAGLANTPEVAGRNQFHKITDQLTVVDDSYNANLASTRAAIDLLAQQNGVTLLVFGDMGELGDSAEAHHREVGRYAAQKGIDYLLTTGTLSGFAAEQFEGAEHLDDQPELIRQLVRRIQGIQAPTTILIKGSRSARMEQVVAALREQFGDNQ
ncbi:UDP-N-acetylmuramoyl-tripeptide--D-alanyl-D-alanine ligase [Ferrimonas marina]|uniref:UDP-N-acetylmuramoyl-tripeptide--D-alanyl-D-alanine ligase n=1 Tax=Ferrimonas marina TaxID=299255 RepID=A0A1M5XGN5_9GAMM|nr:UDP-N-acetylmuramoyl-tripeptide--D-alanyl-D-alanine ligase [Ferrimonas marina]SHH98688.1 UDP-N-acetylmuramoyl-tripeptide--D-alanyl-D-alanine ligase [Ferrimonas marina]